jgi:hypothetical protein
VPLLDLKSLKENSRLVLQGLQIGGTRRLGPGGELQIKLFCLSAAAT